MAITYHCRDYPGMEWCAGSFTASTEDEIWKHIELHAQMSHHKTPEQWSTEEREAVKRQMRLTLGDRLIWPTCFAMSANR